MSQCALKPLSLSKDPLAAAKEKKGAPEGAGADPLLGVLWSPSGMEIPDTLPSTWAARQDTTALRTSLGEDTAGTRLLEGAGPPGPHPALPEPKGTISNPRSGCREQETQERSGEDDGCNGSASLLWAATPGMLFQEDKQTKLHPLVSISGHSAIMMVQTTHGTPAQLSPITAEAFCGFFLSRLLSARDKSSASSLQSLSWVLGYNSSLAVHSLMDGEDLVLLYVSSHTVVIHDVLGNRQSHLQVWHAARASSSFPSPELSPSVSFSWCLGVTHNGTKEQPVQRSPSFCLHACCNSQHVFGGRHFVLDCSGDSERHMQHGPSSPLLLVWGSCSQCKAQGHGDGLGRACEKWDANVGLEE